MLKNNVIPFRRHFEYNAETINNLLEEIRRTPVEPGLLKAMNVQIDLSDMVRAGQGGNVYKGFRPNGIAEQVRADLDKLVERHSKEVSF